jgi:hypothetical protein
MVNRKGANARIELENGDFGGTLDPGTWVNLDQVETL